MELDSDSSSSNDTVEENKEDKNLQQIHDVFLYGDLCEELKRVKQALDENRKKLAQLESVDTVEINSEDDEEIIQIKEISKYEHLCEEINRLKREYDLYQMKLAQIENTILKVTLSQMAPTKLECLVSPMVSPIHNTQDLSEDSFEILPHSPVAERTLRQPEGISDTNMALLQESTKQPKVILLKKTSICPPTLTGTLHEAETIYDHKEALLKDSTKESKATSPRNVSTKESPDSPPVSPIDKIQDTSDVMILKDFTDSEQKYDGKGKQAANPKFRYNKRLTPEVSPVEVPSCGKRPTPEASPTLVPSKETSLMPSETVYGTTDVKSLKLPSPNLGSRISPARKRKSVELDESRITGFSRSSVNLTDDTIIAKKLKFDDEKAGKEEFLIKSGLLTKVKYVPSESFENTDQSCESKELTLSSLSGESKIVIFSSSSEESSLTSGNEEVSRSETENSSLTSESDVPASGKEESSLTSVSDLSNDVPN